MKGLTYLLRVLNTAVGPQLTKATDETITILKNKELIDIHQDPVVGTSISPFRWGVNVRASN